SISSRFRTLSFSPRSSTPSARKIIIVVLRHFAMGSHLFGWSEAALWTPGGYTVGPRRLIQAAYQRWRPVRAKKRREGGIVTKFPDAPCPGTLPERAARRWDRHQT